MTGPRPSTPGELLQQAAQAQQRGDLDGATRALDRLLEDNPGHGQASHLRGVLALQQGKAAEAVGHLRRAVEGGADPGVLANLGIALAASGADQEAEAVLRRAVAADGKHPQAAYNLGHLLAARGQDEEARAWLERAVTLAPSYTRASCELAALLLRADDPAAAEACLDSALGHAPDHPMVLLHLALADRQLGRHAQACARFSAARPALGPQRELMLGLGSSLQEIGEVDAAVAVYRELLAVEPQAYGDVLRALTSAAQGRFDLRPSRLRAMLLPG